MKIKKVRGERMEEKYLVSDILNQVNSSLTNYASAIAQTENPELRQTLQQIRNGDETFQYELFKVAEQKRYYTPAEKAKPEEIDTVKNLFNV